MSPGTLHVVSSHFDFNQTWHVSLKFRDSEMNLMKIRSVAHEFLQTDRQTDGRTDRISDASHFHSFLLIVTGYCDSVLRPILPTPVDKGKARPRTSLEVPKGELKQNFNLGARWWRVVKPTFRSLLPPGHFIQGWVGLRAGLDGCGKSRPTGIRSPNRPARSQSSTDWAIPSHLMIMRMEQLWNGNCEEKVGVPRKKNVPQYNTIHYKCHGLLWDSFRVSKLRVQRLPAWGTTRSLASGQCESRWLYLCTLWYRMISFSSQWAVSCIKNKAPGWCIVIDVWEPW
jgi:hypothetical protein